jgi:alcohol dehydrogenase (cytochrome c)
MKKILVLLVAAIAISGCATSPGPSFSDLKNDGRNTDNILTYGMGYAQNRYSPLDQINKSNVKKLVPVWSLGLENDFGEQAQPMIYEGVMYISDAKWTVAIDAISGKQLWRTPVNFDPDTPRIVCCGVSNKGVALYNGKILRTTIDAHVIALDQKTGKELWRQKVAEWKEGYSLTLAPLIANDVLVTGCSGAEFGARCFLDGWNPDTGEHLWRRYTIPGPNEKGGDTWPANDAYLHGGASTWITGSYDPELDLMYWGTGNAAPYNPENRKGDNLYTASILAVRPKTGEIIWHYQAAPNEIYDWDTVWEIILAEITVEGKPRKVAMQMNRNGFLYVLDRVTGELLSAKPFSKVNWATHVDMKTGRPVESELSKKLRAGEKIQLYPSIRGGKNWMHAAFNPNTGLLYANTNEGYSNYKLIPLEPFKPGFRYQSVESTYSPVTPDTVGGYMEAIDPMTAKPKWRVPIMGELPGSAVLVTGGGLMFTGKQSGAVIAVDADNGKQLWQFKTPSGVNAQPVTWTRNGRQYVTILSGSGGTTTQRRGLTNIPLGGSVWTFALMPE